MNAWSRKGRSGYAEWLPEVDLARARWAEDKPPAPTPLVTRADVEPGEGALGETA